MRQAAVNTDGCDGERLSSTVVKAPLRATVVPRYLTFNRARMSMEYKLELGIEAARNGRGQVGILATIWLKTGLAATNCFNGFLPLNLPFVETKDFCRSQRQRYAYNPAKVSFR